jgi:cyanophycin synthetase
MTILEPGRDPEPLIALEDVPVTLAGISSHNIQNAMAATAAALGIGLPRMAVLKGLRTFVLDADRNPGRTNIYELDGRIVVVDYAHNEAGMAGLVETCQGLRQKGRAIWLAICSAGDRTQQIRKGFAYLAARGSDHLALTELLRYLRGNTREGVLNGLRAGAADAGVTDAPEFEDEMQGLRWMLDSSAPGDVLAVTALAMRPEIFAYLEEHRAERVGAKRIRQLVRKARGRRPVPA